MLAEIYNCFTEGFDTADLKDAKALLDELGGYMAAGVTMRCAKCGAENRETAKFCGRMRRTCLMRSGINLSGSVEISSVRLYFEAAGEFIR